MRRSYRRVLTAALVQIALLCGAAVLAGPLATSLAINGWMGAAGILLATHGPGHVARRHTAGRTARVPRRPGFEDHRGPRAARGDAPASTPSQEHAMHATMPPLARRGARC